MADNQDVGNGLFSAAVQQRDLANVLLDAQIANAAAGATGVGPRSESAPGEHGTPERASQRTDDVHRPADLHQVPSFSACIDEDKDMVKARAAPTPPAPPPELDCFASQLQEIVKFIADHKQAQQAATSRALSKRK